MARPAPSERAAVDPAVTRRHDHDVRAWLADVGAPLVTPPPSSPRPPLEEALAEGLSLAHRDATVARVFPFTLWCQRDRLELTRLVAAADQRNELQTLGCFLEMAGVLGGDPRLEEAAQRLANSRPNKVRLFFVTRHGRYARVAARKKTPGVALKWGFRMNMGLESFRAMFEKFAPASLKRAGVPQT
jgi:hypothetical protein